MGLGAEAGEGGVHIRGSHVFKWVYFSDYANRTLSLKKTRKMEGDHP